MQTVIDIPDTTYREVKAQAQAEKTSVGEVLLRRIGSRVAKQTQPKLGKLKFPLVHAENSGSFDPGEGGIYDYIDVP